MTNIASVLKNEITRLARKILKGELAALKKSSAGHRNHIAALRRQVESLEKAVKKAAVGTSTRAASAAPLPGEEAPQRRFSPARLAKHRERLELSAADFGALIGVSGQSIYKWEAGQARPRAKQLEAIAQVRSLGKREAAEKLAGLQKAAAPAPVRRKRVARAAPAVNTRKRA
jgi:DNA-binding transcriptional regulator YiaG